MARRKSRKHNFRSKLEQKTAAQLEDNKIAYGFERIKLSYRRRVVNGRCDQCPSKQTHQLRTYLSDFNIGETVILEAKGYLDATTRAKMLAVREFNPTYDIRFVFGANNKLNKKKEKRYSDWCEEHNFKYCIRTIPKEWYDEWKP